MLDCDDRADVWYWQFPECKPEYNTRKQLFHAMQEVSECIRANEVEPLERKIEEAMDSIHCLETYLRMLDVPINVLDEVKAKVIEKNRERGYYDLD